MARIIPDTAIDVPIAVAVDIALFSADPVRSHRV